MALTEPASAARPSLTRRDVLRALGSSSALALVATSPPQLVLASEVHRPSQSLEADPVKRWMGSGLGSLYPFIKGQERKAPQSLALLTRRPKDLEAWKAEARARVFELFLYRPEVCPPAAKVLERVDKGDYVRERLTFHTAPDVEVPAFVLVPKRAKFPAPAVVALHCHSGFYYFGKEKLIEAEDEHPMLVEFRRRVYDGLSFPIELARRGYVVIAIDMFYFGERRLILDEDREQGVNDRSKLESVEVIKKVNARNARAEGNVLNHILAAGFTWGGMLAWDDIRTVDYLVTRPEVDAQRIACVGLSIGGYRSTFLAGLDPRIKAACIVGWMTSLRHLVPGFDHTTMPSAAVPGLLNYLDHPDVASLALPAPLMVVHGWKDDLFATSGVEAAFETLTRCYDAIGKPERFKTVTFDGPHKFPAEAQQQMFEWFKRWL